MAQEVLQLETLRDLLQRFDFLRILLVVLAAQDLHVLRRLRDGNLRFLAFRRRFLTALLHRLVLAGGRQKVVVDSNLKIFVVVEPIVGRDGAVQELLEQTFSDAVDDGPDVGAVLQQFDSDVVVLVTDGVINRRQPDLVESVDQSSVAFRMLHEQVKALLLARRHFVRLLSTEHRISLLFVLVEELMEKRLPDSVVVERELDLRVEQEKFQNSWIRVFGCEESRRDFSLTQLRDPIHIDTVIHDKIDDVDQRSLHSDLQERAAAVGVNFGVRARRLEEGKQSLKPVDVDLVQKLHHRVVVDADVVPLGNLEFQLLVHDHLNNFIAAVRVKVNVRVLEKVVQNLFAGFQLRKFLQSDVESSFAVVVRKVRVAPVRDKNFHHLKNRLVVVVVERLGENVKRVLPIFHLYVHIRRVAPVGR